MGISGHYMEILGVVLVIGICWVLFVDGHYVSTWI